MSRVLFALRALGRDFKSGELGVLLSALLIAVCALTAVGFFTDRVGQAFRQQAAEALAADLRVSSAYALDEGYLALARERGLKSSRIQSFPSVVGSDDSTALAGIHAVAQGYPLRGQLRIADQPFGEAREANGIPAPGEAWARPQLLARLGVSVGAQIKVGALTLRISHVLAYRPDQGVQFLDLAPTLLINLQDVPATELVQPGSRIKYYMLFSGTPREIAGFQAELRPLLNDRESLSSLDTASPQLDAAIKRGQSFLNLAALVSVLLASVAVAMAARRYVTRHLDSVALMKCLGAGQGLIIRISLLQMAILAIVAGLLGGLLGYLAQLGLGFLLADLVGANLPPPALGSAAVGLVIAVAILVGFALPAFLSLRRVPPLRVLRHDLPPPQLRYSVSYGMAIAVVILMLWWLVGDRQMLFSVMGGIAVTVLMLVAAGWALVGALSGLRGAAGVAWRYGLANIARRDKESIILLIAFGLGLMVLLLLSVVRVDLLRTWEASLPPDAPNSFMINIQPEDRASLLEFFEDGEFAKPRLSPLVRARLTEINGTPLRELEQLGEARIDWERRDANLTWAAEIQVGNQVVAGSWWPNSVAGPQVSVEEKMAKDMNLALGDSVTFDVAGEPITAEVTSLRTVQWDSFRPNFFMVFSPGSLDDYPHTYVTSLHVPDTGGNVLLRLMEKFPSVTIIDLDSILTQVRDVMSKAAVGVQSVFVFTLIAGVVVLLAAVQASRDERLYESAMLRTLGASRRTVLTGVAVEFAMLGVLAGALAAAGASLAGYLLATGIFELEYTLSPALWLVGPTCGAVLVGLSGVLATRAVVTQAPVKTLRLRAP